MVHRLCELTDHSLIRLQTEDRDVPGIGLICDWPFHWRAGKLTIQEVEPEDQVAIHARVTVSETLPHECRPVDTWIQLRGPVRFVSNPVVVTHIPPDQQFVRVKDLYVRKGCDVLSSPSQTLFEISGSRRAKAHA